MALKFFLMYAIGFFGMSMVLMTVIRSLSNTFGNYGKKPLIFNIVSSVITAGSAFGITYLTIDSFTTFWILSAVFLLFGIIFMIVVHNKYFKARNDNRDQQLYAELLFALSVILLSVAIFSSLQYFIREKNFMFFPIMVSALFFFVPVLLLHTFDAAYNIPLPQYQTWQYPKQIIDLPDEQENEKLYVIGFEIAKKPETKNRTYFRAKAPSAMLLGDLYYHFINDYNEQFSETPIVYNTGEQTNDWLFRTRPKWYQFSRRLDPAISVDENRIKENTVIICERVED